MEAISKLIKNDCACSLLPDDHNLIAYLGVKESREERNQEETKKKEKKKKKKRRANGD